MGAHIQRNMICALMQVLSAISEESRSRVFHKQMQM